MKRLFQIFIVACALTACENDKPGYEPSIERKPIVFDMTETRAAIESSDIEKNGFGVYAFVTNEANTAYESLFENSPEKVSYKNGTWTYTNTKYWLDNRTYQFFGIYPCDKSYSITTDLSGNPNGISRTFTTPATADADLVLASATYDTSVATPESVEMNFEHMLAKVSLNVWRDGAKHQNDQMRIRKVTLSNIGKAGTYSSSTNTWTPTNEKLAMAYENNTLADSDNIGGATKNNDSYQFGGVASVPFNELMLLPQTIDASNNIALKIEYELKRQNAADWEAAELETFLPATTWDSGKKYTYNVVLSSVTDITVYYILTKVDPWGTPQVGGTVIIK